MGFFRYYVYGGADDMVGSRYFDYDEEGNLNPDEEEGFDRSIHLYAGKCFVTLGLAQHKKQRGVGANLGIDGIGSAEVDAHFYQYTVSVGITLGLLPHHILEWPYQEYWPRRFGLSVWTDYIRLSLWERMAWVESDPWRERSFVWPPQQEEIEEEE